MYKRWIAIMMVILLALTGTAAAQTEDGNIVLPQYTHITCIDKNLDIQDGTAQCYASGCSRYADTTTTIRVTLQKRAANETTWRYVCSWSDTKTGKVIATVDEEKAVVQGYDYRIYVKCTIKDSEGVIKETSSTYSRIVSY